MSFNVLSFTRRFLMGVAAFLTVQGTLYAAPDEGIVPTPFRGDTPGSTLAISYADWSKVLRQTVLETGLSNRAHPGRLTPRRASHIIRGNLKDTRNEGNRIDFHSFLGGNMDVLIALRRDLEAVPSAVPLHEFSRNEQLAYWLNLYNLTIITQITKVFPETNLKKYHPDLWDEKVLTVAGIPLSANDIHHKILIPKYRNPLVIYGMFQGYNGGPNIRDEAYTGNNVWRLLQANAIEFINSNRGARIQSGRLYTSHLYAENAALFPDFNADLKRHLAAFAEPAFADEIQSHIGRIKATQTDWYIADLYGGNRAISSASNGLAGLVFAFGPGSSWANLAIEKGERSGKLPAHVAKSIQQIKLKQLKQLREATVEVEEYDDTPDEEKIEDNPEQ